ncbi:RrF2 family transcriptional regulator [Ensifer soli]|uniref:RrF2 family transcriptional regulator n=1 Tax=Ciceribacter sp. sgz301302 TaxID=3342379 RepID=UPI0035BBDFF4
MHISAKSDYAVRAMIELAASSGEPQKCEAIARAQAIPLNFLVNILSDLRRDGIVNSQRGADGGYWLARSPATISVGEIIRAVEGELVLIRGTTPQALDYNATASALRDVWVAYRAGIVRVLDGVSLAQIVAGALPDVVRDLAAPPSAWRLT